jgi:hypothetical protein
VTDTPATETVLSPSAADGRRGPRITGVYWWPVYHALAGEQIEVWVCIAAHMRNVPGRKTDLTLWGPGVRPGPLACSAR